MPETGSKQQHLYELIERFLTAMLVTRADGAMHARPMAVAEIERGGRACYATGIDSPKVAGEDHHAEVQL